MTNSRNGAAIGTVEIEGTVEIVNADTTSGMMIEIARTTSLIETMTEKIVIIAKTVSQTATLASNPNQPTMMTLSTRPRSLLNRKTFKKLQTPANALELLRPEAEEVQSTQPGVKPTNEHAPQGDSMREAESQHNRDFGFEGRGRGGSGRGRGGFRGDDRPLARPERDAKESDDRGGYSSYGRGGRGGRGRDRDRERDDRDFRV